VDALALAQLPVGGAQVLGQDAPGHPVDHQVVRGERDGARVQQVRPQPAVPADRVIALPPLAVRLREPHAQRVVVLGERVKRVTCNNR